MSGGIAASRPRVVGTSNAAEVNPKDDDIVIGLVGYAGSGLDRVTTKISAAFHVHGFKLSQIKISKLIEAWFDIKEEGKADFPERGRAALQRARRLQDLGDEMRRDLGNAALASLAVRRIFNLKASQSPRARTVYLVDSIKHKSEVELLRQVYDRSFYLLAVHCEDAVREASLFGALDSDDAKFPGADASEVRAFMERDAKDSSAAYGQQVREVFWLGDYFVDNSAKKSEDFRLADQVKRFSEIVLGIGWPRPTSEEEGMYLAFGAARRSSCLSRQVGAALQSESGETISVGSNEVPKFGGGTYTYGDVVDSRCFKWVFDPSGAGFVGCHNDRKKRELEKEIGRWLGSRLSEKLAVLAHPPAKEGSDIAAKARDEATSRIKQFFETKVDEIERLPGLKEVIEYSRSIHAEMNALLSAARTGRSTSGAKLFCTTFPCHNCARHLVAAGIASVRYVEPYVKSLAYELHSDAITLKPPEAQSGKPDKMTILPFVGVGPALFDRVFHKQSEVKASDGAFISPTTANPIDGVRLLQLTQVEERAIALLPERRK